MKTAVLTLPLTFTAQVLGATLLVPEDYSTIQDALNVAASGDVVSVAPGTYNENVSFTSDGVTLRSRTPHWAIIDAGGSGNVVTCNNHTATIEGFVITGGEDLLHAGIFTSQASQVIRNNIITGNNRHGILVSSGSVARIERNIITHNGAWGAGIEAMTGATPIIVDNYIAHNRYGIHCSSAYDNVVVANNTVFDHKWNLFFGSTAATVTNNILVDAEIGILFAGSYSPDITYFVSQYLTISYNDVWQNSQYDYYAELGGIPDFIAGPFTPLPGTGELSTDPLLGGTEDYHLQAASPCINVGDPSFVPEPGETDLDGHARILCDRVDMGCSEFGIGDYDCDRIVSLGDFANWEACMTGPDAGPYDAGCEAFDFEFDGDVDLEDFAAFQRAFGGP